MKTLNLSCYSTYYESDPVQLLCFFLIQSPYQLYKVGTYYPHFAVEERGLKWFSGQHQTTVALVRFASL